MGSQWEWGVGKEWVMKCGVIKVHYIYENNTMNPLNTVRRREEVRG
jgi:hypothetical protein